MAHSMSPMLIPAIPSRLWISHILVHIFQHAALHDQATKMCYPVQVSRCKLDYCTALRLALDKTDQEVQRISHWSYQGSTAVAAWLHHNTSASEDHDEAETTLIVANVGDSRAIYGCNGKAIPLTRDHKPDDPVKPRPTSWSDPNRTPKKQVN